MEQNVELPEELELPEVNEAAWRETAMDVGRDFCIVYGAIALIRDIARFMCNK